MKSNKTLLRIISVALILAMSLSVLIVPAFADGIYAHGDGSRYVLKKVTNPDAREGDVDGLLAGGDRASSYCWAMAANAGHIYIGTWANGLWQMVEAIASTGNTLGAGLSEELVDKLAALITNGEVDGCEDDSYYTAKIYRYNETTGEVELLFDPGDHVGDPDYGVITGFRAGVEFKGDVYMDALQTGRCSLFKVTDEDPFAVPEIVFTNKTLRAMCVSVDKDTMYVAGSRPSVPEGYMSAAAIFATKTGNSGDYAPVADEKDFAHYSTSCATIEISDMITMANPAYEGGYELISNLVTSRGIAIFRGHQASAAEKAAGLANEYGWVWTEFAGENSEYPMSFGNLVHVNLNPVVLNNELYFISMTNPMTPLLTLFSGLVSGNQELLFKGLDQVALTCDIECSAYRVKDGKLQMVMGDKEYCPDSIEYVANLGAGFTNEKYGTTMYAWRGIEHEGRLYVNTIDYWNLFSYVTQLTNGELLGMSKDNLKGKLGYLLAFMEEVIGTPAIMDKLSTSAVGGIINENVVNSLKGFVSSPMFNAFYAIYKGLDKQSSAEYISNAIRSATEHSDELTAFCDKYIELMENGILKNLPKAKELAESFKAVKEAITMIAENKDHLESYLIISETVAKEKNPGGEVWCTADGVNWEPITRNGFNDKYNHGIRTFTIGCEGDLYYGCANPYYGAQLWKHTEVDDDYVYEGRQDPTEYEEPESKSFFAKIVDAIKALFARIKEIFSSIFG